MFILALVFVFFTATANAETYAVKKGDNLTKIGKMYHLTWQAIAKANPDVKNPNRIYPGQELVIPTTAVTQQTQAVEIEYTPLNELGRNPFGAKRDCIKLIKMFDLREEVKQLLIAKVQKEDFEWSSIKAGDKFEEMGSGNYRILFRKYANWDSSRLEAARLYKVEFEGTVYLLYDPIKCRNWAWRAEKKVVEQAILPPAEKPLAVVILPPLKVSQPPEVKQPEAPQPASPVVVTPPSPEMKVPASTVTPVAEECAVSYESYGWLGHYWALQGGGQSSYYGGKANFFLCSHETPWGRMREGVGAVVNGWDGDNSGYEFRGNRWSIGPVVDLITGNGSRFTTTLQLGQQRDYGHDGLGYVAKQKTDILYFGQTADFYNVSQSIFKTENWLDLNIDIGHSKESSWQGWPISEANDSAEDKTSIAVGSRVYFWQTENYHGGLVGKGMYAFGDHAIGLEAGPFIADRQDIVKAGAGWRHQFNSKYANNNGNLIGVGIDLDIVKTIDKIVRYLRTTEKEEKK